MSGYLLSDGKDISTLFASTSSGSPTGSVVAFLGKGDIDGWIICDGIERNNNADGRYNKLFSLQIGIGGSGVSNYTPPNLREYFLRGSKDTNTLVAGGNDTVVLTQNQLPSHTHSGIMQANGNSTQRIDFSHDHQLYDAGQFYREVTDGTGSRSICPDQDGFNNRTFTTNFRTSGFNLQQNINIPAHTHTMTIASTGNSEAINTVPKHQSVNYILKY